MKKILLISSVLLSSCGLYESEPSSMEIIEKKSKEDICRPPLKCPYSEESKEKDKLKKRNTLSREQLIARERAYEAKLIEDIPNLNETQICMMAYSLKLSAIHQVIGEILGYKRDIEIGEYWSISRAYKVNEGKAVAYIDYLKENRDILKYEELKSRSTSAQTIFLKNCRANPMKYVPVEMYNTWRSEKT